jgi:hypothetical protein
VLLLIKRLAYQRSSLFYTNIDDYRKKIITYKILTECIGRFFDLVKMLQNFISFITDVPDQKSILCLSQAIL